MTAERTNVAMPTHQTVEFIDAWLNENATWVDTRVMDFALDVRTLLATNSNSETKDREPIGADA